MERTVRLTLGPTGGTVELDGRDVSHAVRGFELTQEVGYRPQLTLDLVVDQVVSSGRTVVLISEAVQELLVSFGWTPPGATPLDPDNVREPANQDAALAVLRRAARLDPAWMRSLLRYQARLDGNATP